MKKCLFLLLFSTPLLADDFVLSDGNLKVVFDEKFPVIKTVEFADKKFEQPNVEKFSLLVNDKKVSANSSGKAANDNQATYKIMAEKLVCTVRVSVKDSEVLWELLSVSGESKNQALHVRMDAPLFVMKNGTTTVGQEIGGETSYVFLSGNGVCVSAYQDKQWNRPFKKADGQIASPGFHWRLTYGTRPMEPVAGGKEKPLPFVTRLHFTQDANKDGTVNWQDGALWVRKQIPQVPKDVRDFFNGGLWMQTHGAFPGNGSGSPKDYDALTTVYSLPDQLLEVQKQIYGMTDRLGKMSYEYVGWNGHGHDYGWPSINEIPFNPALGKDADHKRVKKAMKEFGGDFSFHINMTDITDNSAAWRRGNDKSQFGNRSISMGQGSYGANVFGWNAYFICHYRDYKNAFNRQKAFFKRFDAPKFMYQDVMLDKPANGVRNIDEQYAKMQEVMNWKALGGTSLASEYYYPEKRTGGLLLMKNNASPNTVDQFICAGQTFMHYTRNRGTVASDYIWASLYSDNHRTGDFSVSGMGSNGSRNQTELVFLLSYPNGYCASKGLLRAEGNSTFWGGNLVYSASGNRLSLREDGRDLVRIVFNGGIHGDSFIPGYTENAADFYAYSTNGGQQNWMLPEKFNGKSFTLSRLTPEGAVSVGKIQAAGNSISFTLEAGFAYRLDASEKTFPKIAENVARTAKISSSSSQNRTIGLASAADAKRMPTIPKKAFRKGQLAYYISTTPSMTVDGVTKTFWQPDPTDSAPSLTFNFEGERDLALIDITPVKGVDGSVTIVDGSGKTLAEDKIGKIELPKDSKTKSLTVKFNVPAAKLKIAEVKILTAK